MLDPRPAGGGRSWLGVDLGGTSLRAVLLDEDLRVDRSVEVSHEGSTERVIEALCGVVCTSVAGAGLAVAAWVSAQGTVSHCPTAPLPPGPAGARALAGRICPQSPWVFLNDATAAALAEVKSGGLQGVHSGMLLALGTGIGSGLVLDGRVLTGPTGRAGEFGHLRSGRPGPPCSCGGAGCIEAVAGGQALNDAFRSRGGRGDLVAEARAGNPIAVEVVDLAAQVLADGLADADALVELERVALGGGLGTLLGEVLLPRLSVLRPRLEFVMTHLGPFAGAMGAAYAASSCSGRGQGLGDGADVQGVAPKSVGAARDVVGPDISEPCDGGI